ncbi:hypothetical protein CERSUDRAFT_78437 [Gelatoporia subvermispora B]|uniref:Uncharacterized protein n=1 Tax=Ceriporiopsis subvermispora (strain B) TaxID=914234 RepID=M2Q2R4_CERS8|nr:hypothetical protein CERSUDRAFT_78437 [Gelatoporia subvermispora B]
MAKHPRQPVSSKSQSGRSGSLAATLVKLYKLETLNVRRQQRFAAFRYSSDTAFMMRARAYSLTKRTVLGDPGARALRRYTFGNVFGEGTFGINTCAKRVSKRLRTKSSIDRNDVSARVEAESKEPASTELRILIDIGFSLLRQQQKNTGSGDACSRRSPESLTWREMGDLEKWLKDGDSRGADDVDVHAPSPRHEAEIMTRKSHASSQARIAGTSIVSAEDVSEPLGVQQQESPRSCRVARSNARALMELQRNDVHLILHKACVVRRVGAEAQEGRSLKNTHTDYGDDFQNAYFMHRLSLELGTPQRDLDQLCATDVGPERKRYPCFRGEWSLGGCGDGRKERKSGWAKDVASWTKRLSKRAARVPLTCRVADGGLWMPCRRNKGRYDLKDSPSSLAERCNSRLRNSDLRAQWLTYTTRLLLRAGAVHAVGELCVSSEVARGLGRGKYGGEGYGPTLRSRRPTLPRSLAFLLVSLHLSSKTLVPVALPLSQPIPLSVDLVRRSMTTSLHLSGGHMELSCPDVFGRTFFPGVPTLPESRTAKLAAPGEARQKLQVREVSSTTPE